MQGFLLIVNDKFYLYNFQYFSKDLLFKKLLFYQLVTYFPNFNKYTFIIYQIFNASNFFILSFTHFEKSSSLTYFSKQGFFFYLVYLFISLSVLSI